MARAIFEAQCRLDASTQFTFGRWLEASDTWSIVLQTNKPDEDVRRRPGGLPHDLGKHYLALSTGNALMAAEAISVSRAAFGTGKVNI
jgi:hypothetical protein